MTELARIQAVIDDLTNSSKHTFTYGDVLRIIVRHFPELKKQTTNRLPTHLKGIR